MKHIQLPEHNYSQTHEHSLPGNFNVLEDLPFRIRSIEGRKWAGFIMWSQHL